MDNETGNQLVNEVKELLPCVTLGSVDSRIAKAQAMSTLALVQELSDLNENMHTMMTVIRECAADVSKPLLVLRQVEERLTLISTRMK